MVQCQHVLGSDMTRAISLSPFRHVILCPIRVCSCDENRKCVLRVSTHDVHIYLFSMYLYLIWVMFALFCTEVKFIALHIELS